MAQSLAEIQRTDYARKTALGEGVTVVRLPTGEVSQTPIAAAHFAAFTNPALTPTQRMSNDERVFADAIMACLTPHVLAWGGAGEVREQTLSEMASFVRYYVSLQYPVPDYEKYPIDNGTRYYDCSREDSLGAMRHSELSHWAWYLTHNPDDYGNFVKTNLATIVAGPPLSEDNLAFMWFLSSPLGRVLKMHQFPLYGVDPISESPDAIFTNQTTPWIGSLNAAYSPGEKPLWNDLGMNHYYAWGLTPVHTWIAKQHFYETKLGLLFDLTPFLGGAWAAADAWQTLWEGRTATGVSQDRWLAGAIFASQYALAMLDFAGAEMTKNGLARLASLKGMAKTMSSPEEVRAFMGKLRGLIRRLPSFGRDLGDNVARFRGLLGTPLGLEDAWKVWKSGWRTGFDELSTKRFAAGIRLFLEGGTTRHGVQVVGAQELIVDLMHNGGDVEAVFAKVTKQLEDGVSYATARAYNPEDSDELIFSYLDTVRHGKRQPKMSSTHGGAWVIDDAFPEEAARDVEAFVKGPGHWEQGTVDARTLIKDFETVIDDERFLVKRVEWIYEYRGQAPTQPMGRISYVADESARKAMDSEMLTLFREVADAATPPERVLEIGIRMEYLINQVIPYSGGTSSMGQAFKHAVLQSRGIALGEMRPGVGFDLKAWTRTFDDYLREHPSYYVREAEFIDGELVPPPTIEIPPAAEVAAPSLVLEGPLNIDAGLTVLGVSGGVRQYVGWLASGSEFFEWETTEKPAEGTLSRYPVSMQNPRGLRIEAFVMDEDGAPVQGDAIAVGSLTEAPEDFDAASYPDWHQPGFEIDIPETYQEGDFGIWAVWPGTEMKKKLHPAGPPPGDGPVTCDDLGPMPESFSIVTEGWMSGSCNNCEFMPQLNGTVGNAIEPYKWETHNNTGCTWTWAAIPQQNAFCEPNPYAQSTMSTKLSFVYYPVTETWNINVSLGAIAYPSLAGSWNYRKAAQTLSSFGCHTLDYTGYTSAGGTEGMCVPGPSVRICPE